MNTISSRFAYTNIFTVLSGKVLKLKFAATASKMSKDIIARIVALVGKL